LSEVLEMEDIDREIEGEGLYIEKLREKGYF